MRWLKRKKTTARDPDLAVAAADTHQSLQQARGQRDAELRQLRVERRSVVKPLQDVREGNHLADLAMRALRQRRA